MRTQDHEHIFRTSVRVSDGTGPNIAFWVLMAWAPKAGQSGVFFKGRSHVCSCTYFCTRTGESKHTNIVQTVSCASLMGKGMRNHIDLISCMGIIQSMI
jgi:hypothetical protein